VKLTHFDQVEDLEQQAAELLAEHFQRPELPRHAVMLTGGNTPLGAYQRLARRPPPIDAGLHLLISDERHVPATDPAHNFAKLQPMIRSLKIDSSRVLRVETAEYSLEESADDYHRQLSRFLEAGGRITLGILGIGADGHVASLFEFVDLDRGADRFALAVPRTPGPDRVSVTRVLLEQIERLVVLATGSQKREIVERLCDAPRETIAGRALESVQDVAIWFAQ
jgi:6-phosphogluconolactonase